MTGRGQAQSRPPLLSHEPLRSLYICAFFIYVLCFRLPTWVILYARPSQRPRRSWTLYQAVTATLVRYIQSLVPSCDIQLGPSLGKVPPSWSLIRSTFHFAPPLDSTFIKGFVAKTCAKAATELRPVSCFWYIRSGPKAKGGDSPKAWADSVANGKVALVFHGGAYILGSASEWSPVGALAQDALANVPSLGACLSVDYRLATTSGFPAALIDAIAAYKYLLACGIRSEDIILAGHSAGGNLALALARYLRDHEQLPQAAALLLFSPWCDISLAGHHVDDPNCSSNRNFQCDILAEGLGQYAQRRIAGLLDYSVLESAYLSPCCPKPAAPDDDLSKLFKGFPRTYVTVGGAEQLYDEIQTLGKRMKTCGVDVRMDDEAVDAVHDYVTMRWQQ